MNRRLTHAELRALLPDETQSIAVDLGCGNRKREGFIGVDKVKLEGVDIVCDLEQGLPFADNTVDFIYANFLFEHITDIVFLFNELYRVSADGALIEFTVPYYQSYTQYKDPTHKSVITVEMMRYFASEEWYGSDYGIRAKMELMHVCYHYLPPFAFKGNFILKPMLKILRHFCWNVVHSVTMTVKVDK